MCLFNGMVQAKKFGEVMKKTKGRCDGHLSPECFGGN